MAIAAHDPDKLYSRNSGLKSMSQSSLHDFASTPRNSLPASAGGKKKGLGKLSPGSDSGKGTGQESYPTKY